MNKQQLKLINNNTLYLQRLQRYWIVNIIKIYSKNINIKAHKQVLVFTIFIICNAYVMLHFIYVSLSLYIYTCIYLYVYIYIYIYICIYMYVCICMYVYVYIYIYVSTCKQINKNKQANNKHILHFVRTTNCGNMCININVYGQVNN